MDRREGVPKQNAAFYVSQDNDKNGQILESNKVSYNFSADAVNQYNQQRASRSPSDPTGYSVNTNMSELISSKMLVYGYQQPQPFQNSQQHQAVSSSSSLPPPSLVQYAWNPYQTAEYDHTLSTIHQQQQLQQQHYHPLAYHPYNQPPQRTGGYYTFPPPPGAVPPRAHQLFANYSNTGYPSSMSNTFLPIPDHYLTRNAASPTSMSGRTTTTSTTPTPTTRPMSVSPHSMMESEDHTVMNMQDMGSIPNETEVTLVAEPADYQICNYNIYPTPTLKFEPPVTSNIKVAVYLVESGSNFEMSGGFQSETVRTLNKGGKVLFFNGLKLKKMNGIKSELHKRDIHQVVSYYLKFQIGSNRTLTTTRFKVVSSCTQLPNEVKHHVRPQKRGRGCGTPKLADILAKDKVVSLTPTESIVKKEIEEENFMPDYEDEMSGTSYERDTETSEEKGKKQLTRVTPIPSQDDIERSSIGFIVDTE